MAPNPARGGTVRFYYPAGRRAVVTVWNEAGHVAALLTDASGAGGISWDTSRAADGAYFYRISLDGEPADRTRVLVVQR